MRAKIEIDMNNAAFDEAPATELARILRKAAKRIEEDVPDFFPIMDVNGNRVGEFVLSKN